MSAEGSEIEILYDGEDIAHDSLVAEARFRTASNATPGEAEIVLRDMERVRSFITGKRLKLRVDGQDMWSGFSLVTGRSSFFPAGDGREDTKARKFLLKGVDNNILLDARKLRQTSNYLKAIPDIVTNKMDGWILRKALADYADMPSWLDISSKIDDVVVPAGRSISKAQPWAWTQQGLAIRDLADDLARWSAAVFYIGPDDAVHYHALQTVECPWGFSDTPNYAPIVGSGGFEGAYYGFRELDATDDGTEFGTDAFVWGGSQFAGEGQTVFKRATDDDLEDIHGKWQIAETHFGETNFKTQPTVTQRANMIVFGNPDGTPGGAEPGSVVGEGPRGLRFPQYSFNFGWNGAQVPLLDGLRRHLYPGDIVPIQLWMYSEDGGVTPFSKFLPLRSLDISFMGARGGKAHVFYRGGFDLRNTDSKFLWKFIQKRSKTVANVQIAVVTNDSETAQTGALGQLVPLEAADGSRVDFTLPFGYIDNTTIVYQDGLLQTRGEYYTESDPDAGIISFLDPPATGESIAVVCRVLAGGA